MSGFRCARKVLVRGDTINQYGGLTWKEAMQLDEQDIENQKPHRPCSGLRKELKECLLASDCVKKVNFARSVLSM